MKKTIIYFKLSSLLLFFTGMINAQCPSVTINPLSQTVTCNGPPVTFTAIISPTTNITAQWFGSGGVLLNVSNTSPSSVFITTPGTYTFLATDNTSSCTTTQTVNVAGGSTIPTLSLSGIAGN